MEKFLHYTAAELSQEESFIRWAKDTPRPDDHPWSQWVRLHPEKADDIAMARQIVDAMRFTASPVDVRTEDRLWKRIDTATQDVTPLPSRKSTLRWISYAAAASLLAILCIIGLRGDPYDTHIHTASAQQEIITLPDGSTVTLNADTDLAYDKGSWDDNRTLHLSGEAFFEVEKGSTFSVETDRGVVRVLGTSFNVFARDNVLDVICETGKVSVSSDLDQTILTPRQSVSISHGKHTMTNDIKDNHSRSQWLEGVYHYKETPLSTVILELERQLGVDIRIDQHVKDVLYSGSFDVANKETALQEVFWPLGLQYVSSGSVITVTN